MRKDATKPTHNERKNNPIICLIIWNVASVSLKCNLKCIDDSKQYKTARYRKQQHCTYRSQMRDEDNKQTAMGRATTCCIRCDFDFSENLRKSASLCTYAGTQHPGLAARLTYNYLRNEPIPSFRSPLAS